MSDATPAAATLGGAPVAAPPAAAPTTPAGAPPVAAPAPAAPTTPAAPAAPWWEGQSYTAEERNWLTARGWTKPDMAEVLPSVVKTARNAEQLIGKGVDKVMDRPAKDQTLPAFLKANAAILGLPDKPDAYAVQPPADWPKTMAWDADMEAKARQVAFDNGVPPEAHKAYVEMFAQKMKGMIGAAEGDFAAAQAKMRGELETDWGAQTDARINQARQAAQHFAEKAGISTEALSAMSNVLSKEVGDAAVIRMFQAIGAAMSEDRAVALNNAGGSLTMTPAEARQQLSEFTKPGSDWYEATRTNNRSRIAELKPRYEQLARVAAGSG